MNTGVIDDLVNSRAIGDTFTLPQQAILSRHIAPIIRGAVYSTATSKHDLKLTFYDDKARIGHLEVIAKGGE